MTNLFDMRYGKVRAVVGKLAEAGLTAELAGAILKDPSLARVGVEAIETAFAEAAKYAETFAAAIARCGCCYNDGALRPDVFGLEDFGELGEGYVLGEPTKSDAAKTRGYWCAEDFDFWLAGREVAGNGLEAASLLDLCEYGHNNPEVQSRTAVVCWRPTKGARGALLSMHGGERSFFVSLLDGCWQFNCRVLLRKVRQP